MHVCNAYVPWYCKVPYATAQHEHEQLNTPRRQVFRHWTMSLSHLYSLTDFWRHFGLCRAAAHSDCCFFCACTNILTYKLQPNVDTTCEHVLICRVYASVHKCLDSRNVDSDYAELYNSSWTTADSCGKSAQWCSPHYSICSISVDCNLHHTVPYIV